MKKNDIIIVVIVLAAAGLLYLFNQWQSSKIENDDLYVEIYVDNDLYERIPLDAEKEVVIDTDHGLNVVKVENNSVVMTESSCPDQVCVRTGYIYKPGRTIVCLPYKVYVQIVGETDKDDELDAISE